VVFTKHYYDTTARDTKADLVIVHDKRFVLHKNHRFFAQGCPVFSEKDKKALRRGIGFPEDAKVICSFGFIMRWKRLEYFIPLLLQHIHPDKDIYVILAHSVHPRDKEYGEDVVQVIESAITGMGLSKRIYSSFSFLDKGKINNLIQASDIGVLYADAANSTGSSAVTKEYVAGRCPIVASEISHYKDLDKGLIYAAPGDARGLIYKTLSMLHSPVLKKVRKEQEQNYREINYREVGKIHVRLYNELLCQ
jgi:hypothetical protein